MGCETIMIYNLSGKLTNLENDYFVINCSGIGFKCKSDAKSIFELKDKLNSDVTVFTFLNIKENSCDLFGFSNSYKVDFFKMLTSVKGVGSKAALSILSEFYPDNILSMIISGDHQEFTVVNGVGDKMARRIILELKEKMKKVSTDVHISNNKSHAIKALEVLGYSVREVSSILESLDNSLSVEELIKQSLKLMGK